MKHETIAKERTKLRNSIANTDCTKGLQHFQNNLVFQVCELGSISEEMAQLLDVYARLMGHGETYAKVCDALARLNRYHEMKLSSMENGSRFDEPIAKISQAKQEKYEGTIFGLSQKEIAIKQGGGELK